MTGSKNLSKVACRTLWAIPSLRFSRAICRPYGHDTKNYYFVIPLLSLEHNVERNVRLSHLHVVF